MFRFHRSNSSIILSKILTNGITAEMHAEFVEIIFVTSSIGLISEEVFELFQAGGC